MISDHQVTPESNSSLRTKIGDKRDVRVYPTWTHLPLSSQRLFSDASAATGKVADR
jgi:hypothetical protein